MPKQEPQPERRRFFKEGDKRDKWTDDQRKEFLDRAEKMRPYVQHLTTKAPEEKKKDKDFLSELFA